MSASSRIPLTVIGGYLGAGKTTLLNRVLTDAHERRFGVIVNDFGEVGIDGTLLDTVHDGVVNLPNGCVCCTVADGLAIALERIATMAIDQVLIEASGVADPSVVGHWGTVPPFRPGGVVVLASAQSIGDLVHDRFVSGEVRRQLSGADLVVLTHADLVGADELGAARDVVASVSDAPVTTAVRGDVSLSDALVIDDPRDTRDSSPREHGDQYTTATWRSAEPISRAALDELLRGFRSEVVRAKGIVRLDDGSVVEVQRVGRRTEVSPSDAVIGDSTIVSISIRPW